jgi:hypothetical protein
MVAVWRCFLPLLSTSLHHDTSCKQTLLWSFARSAREQENTIPDNTIHLDFTEFYTTIDFDSVPAARVQRVGCRIGQRRKEKKLVVSRELQSAIIYKTETGERVTKSHVRRSFTVYFVNSGARLTVSTGAASLPSTTGVIVLLAPHRATAIRTANVGVPGWPL